MRYFFGDIQKGDTMKKFMLLAILAAAPFVAAGCTCESKQQCPTVATCVPAQPVCPPVIQPVCPPPAPACPPVKPVVVRTAPIQPACPPVAVAPRGVVYVQQQPAPQGAVVATNAYVRPTVVVR